MSDTPRTDEELDHIQNVYHHWVCRPIVKVDEDKCVVDAKFAKQLEIELNEANKRIKQLEEAGDALSERCEVDIENWYKAKKNK